MRVVTKHAPEAEGRTRRLVRAVGTSLLSRGLAALVPLVTVPIALTQLGASGYGAWSAALALTAFAMFADLGLGVGLMTRLAGALADKDYKVARTLVSSGYAAVATTVLVAGIALLVSPLFVDWSVVLGGEPEDTEVQEIALVTLALFLVNVLVALIVRVQYAAQRISHSNVWQGAGAVAGLSAVLLATVTNPGHVGYILLASGVPIIVGATNSVVFFVRAGRSYAPSFRHVQFRVAASLARLGSKFLLVTVLMGVALTTDNWIVAQTHPLEEVPDFAVPARVFALLGVLVSIVTIPLWPIAVEALRRRDREWVVSTTRQMVWITTGTVAVVAVALVILGPRLLDLWLDERVTTTPLLLAGLGVWAIVQAVVAPLFMIQNAAEVLKPQMLGYAILLVILPIKWIVSSQHGYEWIPWVTIAGYVLFIWPVAIVGYLTASRMLARSEEGL